MGPLLLFRSVFTVLSCFLYFNIFVLFYYTFLKLILSSISCTQFLILAIIFISFRGFSFVTVPFLNHFFFLWMQYFLLYPLKDINYTDFDLHFLEALFLFAYFVAFFHAGEFAQLHGYMVLDILKRETAKSIGSSVLADGPHGLEGFPGG